MDFEQFRHFNQEFENDIKKNELTKKKKHKKNIHKTNIYTKLENLIRPRKTKPKKKKIHSTKKISIT